MASTKNYWKHVILHLESDTGNVASRPIHSQKAEFEELRDEVLEKLDDHERYRESVKRAEGLDQKIQRTDDLIDQIVYELYGLTDEEIEIIEESVTDE